MREGVGDRPKPIVIAFFAVSVLVFSSVVPAAVRANANTSSSSNSVVQPASFGRIFPSNSIASDSENKPEIPNVLVSKGCLISINGMFLPGNAETVQAIDPTNGNIYEAWMGCNGIGFARSTDGGKTFQQSFEISGSDNSAVSNSWDPALAVSRDGILYLSFMFQNFGTPFIGGTPHVAVSHDHGASFSTPSKVGPVAPTEFSDRGFIAVGGNGVLYETWDYAPDASVFVVNPCIVAGVLTGCFVAGDLNCVIARSVDGGKTWSAPTPVSLDFPLGGSLGGIPIVEPNGQVDVLYISFKTLPDLTLVQGFEYFTTSADGGQTWSPRVRLAAPDRSFGDLSADWWIPFSFSRSSSGILYASFDTQSGGRDSPWITFSQDDGKTWVTPIRVTPVSNPNLNIMVEVSAADNGKAFVAWVAISPGFQWSVFAAIFTVSGNHAHLSTPVRISNQFGLSGVWGGDTIGVNSLGNIGQNDDTENDGGENNVVVSWGYGVTISGVSASQIFAAALHLP